MPFGDLESAHGKLGESFKTSAHGDIHLAGLARTPTCNTKDFAQDSLQKLFSGEYQYNDNINQGARGVIKLMDKNGEIINLKSGDLKVLSDALAPEVWKQYLNEMPAAMRDRVEALVESYSGRPSSHYVGRCYQM